MTDVALHNFRKTVDVFKIGNKATSFCSLNICAENLFFVKIFLADFLFQTTVTSRVRWTSLLPPPSPTCFPPVLPRGEGGERGTRPSERNSSSRSCSTYSQTPPPPLQKRLLDILFVTDSSIYCY